jgi:LacI family transcriptional regulator
VERSKTKHVALAFPLAVPHLALFMDGVVSYARQSADWTFTVSPASFSGFPETFTMAVESLANWSGDGAITVITSRSKAACAAKLGIPVINLSGTLRESPIPRIMVDHHAIGVLAAEHLIGRGLKNFAYYGVKDPWYARLRHEGFVRRVSAAGRSCSVFEAKSRRSVRQPLDHETGALSRWLKSLETPVGLFAVHDYRARLAMEECRRAGLVIPHDVAIVGVDNDPVICEFSQPSLTSISRSGRQLGYEAAALLDRLMAGESPPSGDTLIEPDGVVARESTDTLAVDDPYVSTAMRFVHDHLEEVFGVERLVKVAAVSRRRLEKGFRQSLGQTPHDFICQTRINRAKELLSAEGRVLMRDAAAACGFPDVRRFRVVFQRLTGTSPTAFRGRPGNFRGRNADGR